MKRALYILVLASLAVSLVMCKKKEEETTKPSIGGIKLTDPDPFVRAGDRLTFKVDASNLYTTDQTDPGTLGMYWSLNGTVKDTLSRDISKSLPQINVIPDEIGSYTVTVFIYALNGNYYTGSKTASFQAIDPDTALQGLEGDENVNIDGNLYRSTLEGGLTWIANNLYGTPDGRDYRGCEVVSKLFGQYYTWEEARTACPQGWRLPTAAEFDQALGSAAGELMVNASFMGEDMWPYWPQVTISNKRLFNAIPTGYMDLTTEQEVFGYKQYACWWTADQTADGELGVFRYIFENQPGVNKGEGSKTSLALNVRCVKAY